MADAVRRAYPACDAFAAKPDPTGYDAVVNTSSVGMKPEDAMLFDPSRLTPDMTVSEIIMSPEMTLLLLAAQQRGCRIGLGKTMLEHQVRRLAALLLL